MTDLTRYWHDESVHLEPCECMVPDSTLQAIADAWNEGPRIDYRRSNLKHGWPKLADLLDGLVNDE